MNSHQFDFPEEAQTLGDRIKFIRDDKGISREQLAGKIGVSHRTVAHYEQGSSSPTVAMLYKIANRLRVSPIELAFGKSQTTKLQTEQKYELDESGKQVSTAIAEIIVLREKGFPLEKTDEIQTWIANIVSLRRDLKEEDWIHLTNGYDVEFEDLLEDFEGEELSNLLMVRLIDKAIVGLALDLLSKDQLAQIMQVVEEDPQCWGLLGYSWESLDEIIIAENVRAPFYKYCLAGKELPNSIGKRSSSA